METIMPRNKSQMAFWANSIIYFSLFDGMKSYLKTISTFLKNQAVHLKKNEPAEFEDEVSAGNYAIAVEQYDDIFPILLGSSFIIVLVSTLERELSAFTEVARKVSNIEIHSAELKGSFHEQFKTYLLKVARISFDFDSNVWNDIKGLIEVRNTIVHNAGRVDNSTRGRRIKIFSQRYPALNIKGKTLCPTIPFCNQMIQLVHTFLSNLTKAAYRQFK